MLPWWDRWPGRREAELESFRLHGLEFTQDDEAFEAGRLVLNGTISIREEGIDLTIVYPDSYPFTRFSVLAPNLSLSRHQHPFGKNLCVFPRASVFWDRRWLAGNVVNERVPEVVDAVKRGGEYLKEVEDPQGEPYTDYYTYWPLGGFVLPSEIMDAAKDVDYGEFTIRMARSAGWLEAITSPRITPDISIGTGIVTSLKHDGKLLARAPETLTSSLTGPSWTGTWVRLEKHLDSPDPNEFMRQVRRGRAYVKSSRIRNGKRADLELGAVVFPEEVEQSVMDDAWIFVVSAPPKQPTKNTRQQRKKQGPGRAELIRGMRGGRDHLAVRIPELSSLQDTKVSLIGLGTLGSPLAKEFARNLVGELHVVDHDFVDAATSVRWEKGLGHAGSAKSLSLAEDLRRNYPYTKVVPHIALVGATPNRDGSGDRELFAEAIDGSSLIVDATAEDNVTAAVADAAWERGIPFISLWSIEGIGGIVARIIPGETGCFHCMERRLSPECGDVNVPPPPENPRRVQPRGCADPTFTSPAPDLLPLVNQASRMAFGELCVGNVGAYPRYQNDLYVLWLRHPDGSLHDPPRWDAHQLTVHPDCPCHDVPQS